MKKQLPCGHFADLLTFGRFDCFCGARYLVTAVEYRNHPSTVSGQEASDMTLTPEDYNTPAGRILRNLEDHLADFHEDNGPLMLLVEASWNGGPMGVIEAIREKWLHEYDRTPDPG